MVPALDQMDAAWAGAATGAALLPMPAAPMAMKVVTTCYVALVLHEYIVPLLQEQQQTRLSWR